MSELKGCIFNMQKFSIHDGPGIRTVVFFKGCPLRCHWCSNPESQSTRVQILWAKDKCIGCRHCIDACPKAAVSSTNNRILIDSDQCIACHRCVSECQSKALSAEGEQKTISEIVSFCLQDMDFYMESNGGVTLSGGEVLAQPHFAVQLLKELKKNHLHTAIETTGFAPFDTFKQILSHLDLLLFDIKHYSNEKHIQATGVSNSSILTNLKYAIEQGKKVIVRIPVIPNVNSLLKDAKGFCQLLKPLQVTEINLLPFHQFGEKKYDLLGQKYSMSGMPSLHEEDLEDFKNIFLENGFQCYF